MSLIRSKQSVLTRLSPHNANSRFIVPNRKPGGVNPPPQVGLTIGAFTSPFTGDTSYGFMGPAVAAEFGVDEAGGIDPNAINGETIGALFFSESNGVTNINLFPDDLSGDFFSDLGEIVLSVFGDDYELTRQDTGFAFAYTGQSADLTLYNQAQAADGQTVPYSATVIPPSPFTPNGQLRIDDIVSGAFGYINEDTAAAFGVPETGELNPDEYFQPRFLIGAITIEDLGSTGVISFYPDPSRPVDFSDLGSFYFSYENFAKTQVLTNVLNAAVGTSPINFRLGLQPPELNALKALSGIGLFDIELVKAPDGITIGTAETGGFEYVGAGEMPGGFPVGESALQPWPKINFWNEFAESFSSLRQPGNPGTTRFEIRGRFDFGADSQTAILTIGTQQLQLEYNSSAKKYASVTGGADSNAMHDYLLNNLGNTLPYDLDLNQFRDFDTLITPTGDELTTPNGQTLKGDL